MLLLPLLLPLLFVASAITAVAACISDTCVICPSPWLWLKSLLLTMKLMMVVLVLVLMTSRAHSCAARSCDPSIQSILFSRVEEAMQEAQESLLDSAKL